MTTYGLTPEGFVAKTTAIIREEINAELRGALGASIALHERSLLGTIVGVMAERYGALWELSEAVNDSMNPDNATGASLRAICAITGTNQDPALPSEVTLTLTGTPATVIASGQRVSNASTGSEWLTTEAGTLVALTAWASTTAYVAGDRRTNGGRAYVCITAGTSAGSGGPTTTSDDITDGTVHWRYMGEGTGAVDVGAESDDDGPVVGTSGDITEIKTPVAGWSSVINLLDATLGTAAETDEDLRIKRVEELGAQGSAPFEALRSALLAVDGVTSVRLFVNNTDTTDGDGVPPHAIEPLVEGGDDQDIFDALHANVAAGIRTHGTESGTVTDSQGVAQAYEFSRPADVNIWIIVNLTYDADSYEGDAAVESAITAWGAARGPGYDAVASAISGASFRVDGVLDVTSVLIGTSNPPVASTTIAIAPRERAKYDTSRITINSTPGTP